MIIRTPWGEQFDVEPTAPAIWEVLEKGVRWAFHRGVPPHPYTADVAYRREPQRHGRRRDNYQPWWEVDLQKHGDCEDLAMWLVAYLRATGEDRDARVALIEWPNGGWHAVVYRSQLKGPVKDEHYRVSDLSLIYGPDVHLYAGPDLGWDPDGFIEDPSRRLGMRDTARAAGAFSPFASLAQREPGRTVVGRDPYLPFELAGIAARGLTWADVLEICGR